MIISRQLSNLGGQNTIMYFNLENPYYHPVMPNDRYGKDFEINLTMTYQHNSDIVTPYGKWVYTDDKKR